MVNLYSYFIKAKDHTFYPLTSIQPSQGVIYSNISRTLCDPLNAILAFIISIIHRFSFVAYCFCGWCIEPFFTQGENS